MFRDIYKSASSRIKLDERLISETKESMKNARAPKQRRFYSYRYAAVACCCILFVAIIAKTFSMQWGIQNNNTDKLSKELKTNTGYSLNTNKPQQSDVAATKSVAQDAVKANSDLSTSKPSGSPSAIKPSGDSSTAKPSGNTSTSIPSGDSNTSESGGANIPANFISIAYEDALKKELISMYVPKYLPSKSNYRVVFHKNSDVSSEVSVITSFGIKDENGIINSEVNIFTRPANATKADIINDNDMKSSEFLNKLQTGKGLSFIYNDVYISISSYGHEFSPEEIISVIQSVGVM